MKYATKECNICHSVKSINSFDTEKKNRDGHVSYCKSCRNIHKEQWHAKQELRRNIPNYCKRCPKCECILDIDKFRKSRNMRDGLSSWCSLCLSQSTHDHYERNKDKILKQEAADRIQYPDKYRERSRKSKRKLREEVLRTYGGDIPSCACCHTTIIYFLCIDHIDGGGNAHKRMLFGKTNGGDFYSWLKREGYPPGYRVLCYNCNSALGYYGYCPHSITLPSSSSGS